MQSLAESTMLECALTVSNACKASHIGFFFTSSRLQRYAIMALNAATFTWVGLEASRPIANTCFRMLELCSLIISGAAAMISNALVLWAVS